jgi:hypothetical protein
MATLAELHDALVNADKAGDTEAARQLADAIVAAGQARETKPSPVDGMSTTDKVRAGIGRGLTSVGRAVTSALTDTPIGGLNRAIHSVVPGLPGRIPTAAEAQAAKEESARLDQPLMGTTSGKVGNMLGMAAAASPALLIPGANTYLGSALAGGGTGVVTTEGGGTDRLEGGAMGALGGLTGKGVGDVVGAGVSKLAQWAGSRNAAKQAANAGRDAAVVAAKDAGYVLPPTEANPNMLNSLLEGLSGKIKTAQAASTKNQSTTNRLAKEALGLPEEATITKQALGAIRAEAGKAYDSVASAGTITPGPKYTQALDSIMADAKQAAKDFPASAPNPVIKEIEALKVGSFDASSAVAKIKTLRAEADAAYGRQDKALGKALKDGAAALEDAIEEHLKGAGPDVLKQFRQARQLIAKTYTVEKALTETGDVAASSIAAQLKRGKPLTDQLRTIGQVGSTFPKATQSLPQSYSALSPLDYAVAAGTGNVAGLAARPAARSAILSQPYQAAMVRPPTYDPQTMNLLARLLESRLLPASGYVAGTQLLPTGQQ